MLKVQGITMYTYFQDLLPLMPNNFFFSLGKGDSWMAISCAMKWSFLCRILNHAQTCARRTRANAAADVATLSGVKRRRNADSTKTVWRGPRTGSTTGFTGKTSSHAGRKVASYLLLILISLYWCFLNLHQSVNNQGTTAVTFMMGGGGGVLFSGHPGFQGPWSFANMFCISHLFFPPRLPLSKRIWAFWRKRHGEGIRSTTGESETWKVSNCFHLLNSNLIFSLVMGDT